MDSNGKILQIDEEFKRKARSDVPPAPVEKFLRVHMPFGPHRSVITSTAHVNWASMPLIGNVNGQALVTSLPTLIIQKCYDDNGVSIGHLEVCNAGIVTEIIDCPKWWVPKK